MVKHENAPRTSGGCFAHTNICSVPEEGVSGTEYHSCTRKACFLHRMPLKMRRVPQEGVLRTECLFRTVEACFEHGGLPMRRVPQEGVFAHRAHIPYHRWPSPVPNEPNATNATNARGKRSLPQTALPEIQQTPKRGLFPDGTTSKFPPGKFPAAAIPWQQGNIYSSGGAPTHRFNYFLTLFL